MKKLIGLFIAFVSMLSLGVTVSAHTGHYKVTLIYGDETIGINETEVAETYTSGQIYEKYNFQNPTCEDFAFVRWVDKYNVDGNGEKLTYSGTKAIESDITVVAEWEPGYQVTFDLGYAGKIKREHYRRDEVGSFPTIKGDELSGYKFEGWYLNGVKVKDEKKKVNFDDKGNTFVAKWVGSGDKPIAYSDLECHAKLAFKYYAEDVDIDKNTGEVVEDIDPEHMNPNDILHFEAGDINKDAPIKLRFGGIAPKPNGAGHELGIILLNPNDTKNINKLKDLEVWELNQLKRYQLALACKNFKEVNGQREFYWELTNVPTDFVFNAYMYYRDLNFDYLVQVSKVRTGSIKSIAKDYIDTGAYAGTVLEKALQNIAGGNK